MASLGKFAGSELQEPSADFSPIPAGVYDVEVVESDIVSTKAGDGTIVKLTFRVLNGQHEGRQIWANLNIENRNPKAQEIGQRELSDLSRACGFAANPERTEDFHGIPLVVNVKLKPGDGEYGPRNEVGSFKAASHARPAPRPAPVQRQAAQAAPATNGGAKPSWMTRKTA